MWLPVGVGANHLYGVVDQFHRRFNVSGIPGDGGEVSYLGVLFRLRRHPPSLPRCRRLSTLRGCPRHRNGVDMLHIQFAFIGTSSGNIVPVGSGDSG